MTKRMALGGLLIGLLLAVAPALAEWQRIAVQRFLPQAPSNILIVNRDGRFPRDLIKHQEITGKCITPALSPDGQTLAFCGQVGAHFQLFLWQLDEENNAVGHPVRLTKDDKADAKFPVWSPDGSKIAFLSTNEDGKTTLRMINRDGSGLKVLLYVNYNNSSPCWKSDGESLLFIDKIGGRTVLRQIPAGGGFVVDIRPSATISAACYSPDGAKIAAFFRRNDGLADLWILSQSGATGVPVVKGIVGGNSIAWPDQETIIFNAIKVSGQPYGNAFWIFNTKTRALNSFTGYSDPKQITNFSVQKVTPLDSTLTVADINDATGPGANVPRERVPTGAVTIVRPFQDTLVRGVVPIRIIAQKHVSAIVLRINDQFVYTTEVRDSGDKVPEVVFNWDTQQLANFEPSRGSGIPAIYQDRNKKVQLRRFPDDVYTITAVALVRDNHGNDQKVDEDSIKVTVQNAIPDHELPGNIMLRYQYREAEPDEEYLVRGEGTLFGADLPSLADLNATFTARLQRSLVDIRPNGGFDLRARLLRATGSTGTHPLTFGLKAFLRVPEEDVSALYMLTPNGEFAVVAQMRERVFLPLAQVGLPFPNTPVRVGSQWQGKMWIVGDVLGREGIEVKTANHIVDGAEWIGDHRTIRIRSDFRLASENTILPTTPTQRPPANFDAMLAAQRNGLKTDEAVGVRYTWFDYDRNQVVRVEDYLLYTFQLASIESMVTQPAPTPGYGQPVPPAYGPTGTPYYPPGMAGDPAYTTPGVELPAVYGGGMASGYGGYAPPPGAQLPPGAVLPGYGGMGAGGVDAPPPYARAYPPGGGAIAPPPGAQLPPGAALPGYGGMGVGGEDAPPAYAQPGYVPPAAPPLPGVTPPFGNTPPGAYTPPAATTPPRTGTTPGTGYTQPKPRTGNGYYLVRWSYRVPVEEPEEE